jgi:hypothetical protein
LVKKLMPKSIQAPQGKAVLQSLNSRLESPVVLRDNFPTTVVRRRVCAKWN